MDDRRENYIDPFGAPEIFAEGVAYREMVGTDIVRIVFYANEQGERVIRVKILIPFVTFLAERVTLNEFIQVQEMAAQARAVA